MRRTTGFLFFNKKYCISDCYIGTMTAKCGGSARLESIQIGNSKNVMLSAAEA